ncbi:MAG: SipW-dependent-type signal peptide-containing protein, partial [Minisyncoccia bacterium]
MNRKILMSLGVLVFVGALSLGATGAFFSDSETSTGNTFTAGDIDLKIDNESYITNSAGVLVASPANSWAMSNLTGQLFFSFSDVKPGDVGEDTISVHVGSNDAWACMAADITATPENTLVDPESDAGDVGPALGDNGELQTFLNFTFWKDDGDNVYETGETQITQLTGQAGTIFNGNWLPLADSANGLALVGGSTSYIGKAWCFGSLALGTTTQDGLGKVGTPQNPNNTPNGPLIRGTGVTCNGSGANNVAQTDGVVVDVSFQAVQSRNNGQFLCSNLPPLVGGPIVVNSDTLESNILNASTSKKWYFYDDTSDVLNNSLGGFVVGPAVPPLGTGSALVNPLAGPTGRTLLTNGGFGGTLLSTITNLSYGYYQPSGAWSVSEAPFLRFNVDFAGSPAYQNSLVYVPSAN